MAKRVQNVTTSRSTSKNKQHLKGGGVGTQETRHHTVGLKRLAIGWISRGYGDAYRRHHSDEAAVTYIPQGTFGTEHPSLEDMEFTDRPLWFCYKAKDSKIEDMLVLSLFPFLLVEELPPWCPTLASAIFIHYITPWVPFIISRIIKDVEKFWQGAFRFFYSIRIGYPVILLGIVRNKSSEPEPTFQYSDLAEGYIRLLSIQGINSARHVFNLKLCDFPLHELPPYYAVSYTWDNQPNSHLILINNQWLSASSNVSSILSLFAPSVFGQRYLWIDAICINQTNKVEKATQVKLMRDIYRNAKSVLVWLSSENLNQDNQRHNQYILSISTRQLYDTCQDLFNRVMPLEWTNLDGVLVHRYWRRAWIIQEFVVSSQPEVYFRGRCIDWRSFTSLLESRVFENMHSRIHSNPTDMTYGLNQISTLMEIRGEFHMGKRYQIQNLLHRFGGSRATDSRDKVFALQGLAAPTSLKNPSTSNQTQSSCPQVDTRYSSPKL